MRITRPSAAATEARNGPKKWEKPLTPTYDENNIFAKILRGEAPCAKVYEDDVSFAFMDVMPRAEGHTLVIPRAPARTLFDLDAQNLARFMPAVQKIGRAVMVGMKAEGLLLQQFNEPASGQQVFHLHFHLLPCWTGVAIRPPGGPFQSPDKLKPYADKIIAALARA
jgi:histidine triad (HIT) family protein